MADAPIGDRVRKGRGAPSNSTGRFEPRTHHAIDDGWGGADAEPPALRTTVQTDASRTIIARNDSPDIGFDQSINAYRGCEHGCVYCYARPTHAYLGLSPGLDFESRLFAKPDAPALLVKELSNPRYVCKPIALGTNTDCYQPIERRHRITRGIVEVLAGFANPVSITTKSALVERDIDLLSPMAACGLVHVTLSITTLDRALARRLEPRAATPERRLETIQALAAAHIPTSVNVAPIIPGLTDPEIEAILKAARDAGATGAAYTLLRLPLEVATLFREWLATHSPDRAKRVLSLVRQIRGGALYKSEFGTRMRGEGPIADLISKRFHGACRRLGLHQPDYALDCSQFKAPAATDRQFTLAL